MTIDKNPGQCICGVRGEMVMVSPSILKGGMSRDTVWEVTNQGRSHLVRFKWNDDKQGSETICLRTENKF
jgi:hypothetical protein